MMRVAKITTPVDWATLTSKATFNISLMGIGRQ
jgi:hypothetical protein